MAYFLKISHYKKGTYLQIYESFHDKTSKSSKHRSFEAIGYLNDLIAKGIEDPISFYKEKVAKLNEEKKKKEIALIDKDPTKNLGYFLIKSVFNSLKIKEILDLIGSINNLNYSLYDYLIPLVCARVINPCSKLKTFDEVLPTMYEKYPFSLDTLYSGLEVLGLEHERILELINNAYSKKYKRKTGKVYFDCTNYYFEIDNSYDDKQKGPSKENRNDPIIGMGLLLDEEQIPLTMKMFPGNQSEKPIIREVINDMKNRYDLKGRTIQVADKGLNCGKNIVEALKNGDGYIFSQSVKMLEQKEKNWILLNNDYVEVKDEEGRLLYKYKSCIDDFNYKIETEEGKKNVTLKQIRVVSFNPTLAKKQILEINKLASKAKELSVSKAKRSEYGDAAKYVSFKSMDNNGEIHDDIDVISTLNTDKVEQDLKLAGYNMIISSEVNMNPQEIYSVYHKLWRIEETFKILKSKLEARPVYLQKKESIYGHFLICFLSIFALRVLQLKKFNDKIHTNSIIRFCKDFKVVKLNNQIYNLSNLDVIKPFEEILNLELTKLILNENIIKKVLCFKA